MFGGEPVLATDLEKFSHHASPIFLSANLDGDAENVLDALKDIPGLVGVELAISGDVSRLEMERISQLKNVELVVLNNGLLDAELIGILAKLPKLKVLRVQGRTKIGDFRANWHFIVASLVLGQYISHCMCLGTVHKTKPCADQSIGLYFAAAEAIRQDLEALISVAARCFRHAQDPGAVS